MTSGKQVYLPTEILVEIAEYIRDFREDGDVSQTNHPFLYQTTLYNFCLVSRRWYSAGIEMLYSQPDITRGNSFALFTSTVCPPLRAKKPSMDFGSMVRFLWLDRLVHHSSNSLTSRLLGRVKKNLQIFVAPRTSFSINSLAPLSKCTELIHLRLGLVIEPIELPVLKKAISNLHKLKLLVLPSSMLITDDQSGPSWPSNIQHMQLGGRFDLESMPTFRWPPNLKSLTFCGCEELNTFTLELILMNEQLCSTLRTLSLHPSNGNLLGAEDSPILSGLLALRRLELPIDLLYSLHILPPSDEYASPLSIRELILMAPYDDDSEPTFDLDELYKALGRNLSRVCGLGIYQKCLGMIPKESHARIDKKIWRNIDECPEIELDYVYDLGLYEMETEQC
ncbi:uncharacterized protein N7511_010524 [Penicillium nucicola]|uniref:uncharacterized protein n=1 Tax=Penicillium nucicola TaxID=1850975 RepID=UPI0025457D1A|nr:uncharacterized protein N7511_010524 [Penicillium nucicola]KAJ5748828.1 hypothetical protein N7511_010524 [Penicillium nucicola]